MSIDIEALKRWTQTGGVWTPFPICISWLEIGAIMMIIEEFNIRSFVELGSHRGGLSAILFPRAKWGKLRYNGIEIDEKFTDTGVYEESFPKFNLRVGNIWDNINWLMDCMNPSPALMFCDGGDKQKEVDTFSPLISSSDFLLVHDYLVEWDRLPDHFYRVSRWYLENTTLVLLSRRFI